MNVAPMIWWKPVDVNLNKKTSNHFKAFYTSRIVFQCSLLKEGERVKWFPNIDRYERPDELHTDGTMSDV